jgi:hypothetical protein
MVSPEKTPYGCLEMEHRPDIGWALGLAIIFYAIPLEFIWLYDVILGIKIGEA